MQLHLHNITQYYIEKKGQKQDPDINVDLYEPGQLLSEERSCNNLVQLNATLLMAICKSDVKSKNSLSVSVFVRMLL
jgi:hypothetical protein